MDERERDVSMGVVSRREFLRMAGAAGAVVGLGAGFGGLVAGCGGETTTTAAPDTSTTAPPEQVTTTATAGEPASGREIIVGFVAPITGPLANFGVADKYLLERWNEAVADGVACGDGKTHPIKIIMRDSQSDTNRAAQVAADLIMNDKVDIMMAASTPETVNPVSDQCETLEMPCFTNDAPWQAYYFGRGATPDTPFKWTYHHFWGVEDLINVYVSMWEAVETNKIVGALWPNDSDGAAFSDSQTGFPSVVPGLGYTVIDPGRYQNFTEDYTAEISLFKREGCELLTGVPMPPDFTNFWKQAMQQGFKPKVASIAKALDYPWGVEALGAGSQNNFTIELMWSPRYPFASSLTGETCQQIGDDFEARTGLQWAGYLLHYAIFEVVVDALKRCSDVDDKEAIIGAIRTTKMDNTLYGPIDFTAPIEMGSMRPVENVYRSPLVGGQWKLGSDSGVKWPYELVCVSNANYPTIDVEGELEPMIYD